MQPANNFIVLNIREYLENEDKRLGEDTLVPVSYTHLEDDRQRPVRNRPLPGLLFSSEVYRNISGDVYKRQIQMLAE